MTPFDAYRLYVSLKNHFSKSSYDYTKYNGKTNLKIDTFEKRKDKVFFQKLAKHPDLEKFLIANFVLNSKYWVRDLAYSNETESNYKNWLKKQQSISYIFKNDLNKLESNFDSNFKIKNNEHPEIIKLYLSNEITLETFCILIKMTECETYFDKKLDYDPVWIELKMKVNKYFPFIDYDQDKFRKICLDSFEK